MSPICLFCGKEKLKLHKICRNCIDHIATLTKKRCPKCGKTNIIKINPTDWILCINCGFSFNVFKLKNNND